MTYYESIKNIINSSDNDALFTAKDFYNITNYQNSKLILNRLYKAGIINRVIDGIYYKPRFVKAIDGYSTVSPFTFANKIASIYNWSICASGEAALNLFGLSTQVPNRYIFESDGPYREYTINNTSIYFKHTNNKNIKNISFKVGTLIQALKYLGQKNINNETIKICSSKLNDLEKKELILCVYLVPVWLSNIIYEIGEYKNE